MLNSDRFLGAFNSIERYLRKVANQGKDIRFSALVDSACNSNPAVRHLRDDLKEFADLRNAIVHERTDCHVLAEPNDKTVLEIEHINSLLINQPKIISQFHGKVYSLFVNDPISKALEIMYTRSYSQIPIYNGSCFTGLLTSNTVTRWLGSCVKDDIFSLSETKINHVLKFTEDPDHYCFSSRNSTIFEAFELFQTYELKGKRLDAILLTQNGKPSEVLLGIITIWNLSKFHDILSIFNH